MIKEKLTGERHDILQKICDEMNEELFAAKLYEEEGDNKLEILRILFDDIGFDNEDGVVGEFLFLPLVSEEDEVQYFTAAMTIADVIPQENLSKLYEAIAVLNFYIPCGAFSIDKNKQVLAYKMTNPIPIALTGDALYEQVNVSMGNAVAITDQYCDLILRVNAGELEVEDMLEEIGV